MQQPKSAVGVEGGRLIRAPADVVRIAELETALRLIAVGRKPCASGTQRMCRDDLTTLARETCVSLGIKWD